MRASTRYVGSVLLLAGLLATTQACASGGYYVGVYSSPRYARADLQRRAYDQGYRAGVDRGVRDMRSRNRFDYRRFDDYRRGDRGYWRGFGDRSLYRDLFRRGFEAGYRSAYRYVR